MSKRLLFVGEFSGLATGYGNYSREVLGRLHAGGLEVAEYSSYVRDAGSTTRTRGSGSPPGRSSAWCRRSATPGSRPSSSSPHAQFGRMRFEEQLLSFARTFV
jgi:hypothetical protein